MSLGVAGPRGSIEGIAEAPKGPRHSSDKTGLRGALKALFEEGVWNRLENGTVEQPYILI